MVIFVFGRKKRIGGSLSANDRSDLDTLAKDVAHAYKDIVAVAPLVEA